MPIDSEIYGVGIPELWKDRQIKENIEKSEEVDAIVAFLKTS